MVPRVLWSLLAWGAWFLAIVLFLAFARALAVEVPGWVENFLWTLVGLAAFRDLAAPQQVATPEPTIGQNPLRARVHGLGPKASLPQCALPGPTSDAPHAPPRALPPSSDDET